MSKLLSFIFIALAVFLFSCSGSDAQKKRTLVKKGAYAYIVSDSSGKSLVEGVINIDAINKQSRSKSYTVTGTYTITSMTKDTLYTAFSSMREGDFSGYYDETLKLVNINTNPKIADANVFINANVKGKEITGGWYFSTLRGINKEGGLFSAARK